MAPYRFRKFTTPTQVEECLEKMLDSARKGKLTGIAFVGYVNGSGFIADTCGDASMQIDETIKMIRHLESLLAKRQLQSR